MRKIYFILIVLLCFLIPLAVSIILVAFLRIWWIIWTDLILEFIGGIIFGIVMLILKLSKRIAIPKEVDIKEYKARAVNEKKDDDYNPDNFLIKRVVYWQDKSTGKPLALILRGIGTELNNTIVAIFNLKSIDKEISWMEDLKLDDEEIEKKIEETTRKVTGTFGGEIKEEIVTKDVFGNPIATKTTVKPSPEEMKKETEKEEAESKNIT